MNKSASLGNLQSDNTPTSIKKNKIKIIHIKKGESKVKKSVNTQSMMNQYRQAQLEKDIDRWQLNPILEQQEVFEGGLTNEADNNVSKSKA